jgi:hypothetical protein
MAGQSSNVTDSSTPTPYGKSTTNGITPGHDGTCELCHARTRVFNNHGFTACKGCHETLLPGSGVL